MDPSYWAGVTPRAFSGIIRVATLCTIVLVGAAQSSARAQDAPLTGPGRALARATLVQQDSRPDVGILVGGTAAMTSDSLSHSAFNAPRAARSLGGPWTVPVHGDHLGVSQALVDPTYTHHAILEDELRVNVFSRSAAASDARGIATLEIAYAFTDAIGAEVILPYTLRHADGAGGSRWLDIEAQPLKWSFLRQPNLIMTAVAGLVIPVATPDAGESRVWRLEPHFFTDLAIGPVALQGNLIGSFANNGEDEVKVLTSVARMFFFSETNSAGPMLETIWEIPLSGAAVEPFLAPGIKLQHAGWYFGASYLFPLRGGSTAPSELALTAGYHMSFSRVEANENSMR